MAPAPKVQMKVDRDLPPNLVQEIKKKHRPWAVLDSAYGKRNLSLRPGAFIPGTALRISEAQFQLGYDSCVQMWAQ
jgi:hypothetical protein